VGNRLLHYWRDSGPNFQWNGPFKIVADNFEITGVAANPVLVQSKFGSNGNFELVTPMENGGIGHYWRDNDSVDLEWHGPSRILSNYRFDSISMIESNFGSVGNFELIARTGFKLFHIWRDSGAALSWNGPFLVTPE